MVKTIEHGVETSTEPTPGGMVDVITYHPHSCPWDCYGRKEQRTMIRVLKMAGIEGTPLVTHRRKLHPIGSGPDGRVRFGDDMLPGVYRIAVKSEGVARAVVALNEFRKEVDQWLDQKGPMPRAIART